MTKHLTTRICLILIILLLSLCACKKEQVSYNILFHGGGGTLIEGNREQSIKEGYAAVAPIFEKEGFVFDGWDENFDCISKDMIITAQWKRRLYKVTFQSDEGILVSGDIEQRIEHGKSATPPNFKRTGYTLSWDKSFHIIECETVVTAIWNKNIYPVLFDGAGGILNSGEILQMVEHGLSAKPPHFNRTGYTFIGWDNSFSNIKGETLVTALWEINTYKVTFNGNGGILVTGEEEQFIAYGDSAVAPKYIKEGFVLSWDKPFAPVTSDITVTAVWLEIDE